MPSLFEISLIRNFVEPFEEDLLLQCRTTRRESYCGEMNDLHTTDWLTASNVPVEFAISFCLVH